MVFGISDDFVINMIWVIVSFSLFIFFYPRLMVAQMVLVLERSAIMLENFRHSGKNIVLRKISKNPTREIREAVSNFLEFFLIGPVTTDPFGIMKKIENVVVMHDKKMNYFADQVAPKMPKEEKANLVMSLSGAMTLNQIAKIVRHFVETVKKTKNLQIAMMLQMQLPMIEKFSKALLKGTEAFANGWPVGDSVGPLVASYLIGKSPVKEVEDDTIVAKKKIKGKTVYIVRAKGPGGRLGRIGKVIENISKKQKISKIITVDAAGKLEGEKTGSIAEGIGVAIGGIGIDSAYIDNLSAEKGIPLDAVAIKMGQEEAIMPMRTEVLDAVPNVIKMVEKNIANTKGNNIVVVGVGNCVGVGNNEESAKKISEEIRRIAKIVKVNEEKEKKHENSFAHRFLGM